MAERPAYNLRPVTAADDALVFDIYRAAMEETTVRAFGRWDDVVERAEHAAHFGFIAEHGSIISVDGEEAGFVAIKSYPEYLYLISLHLLPAFQGLGIGTAIVERLTACAAGQGKHVELEVLKVNPALRLYERLGFTVSREVNEYTYRMLSSTGCGEDDSAQ